MDNLDQVVWLELWLNYLVLHQLHLLILEVLFLPVDL